MYGKYRAFTHPFGKNKIWRTLHWAWQRFFYGYDETMCSEFFPWLLDFVPQACDWHLEHGHTLPYDYDKGDSYDTLGWAKELYRGKELFLRAKNVLEGEIWIDDYKEEQKVYDDAIAWFSKNWMKLYD